MTRLALAALITVQVACVSNRYEADPASLIDSPDCRIVNGDFSVESESDGRLLADYLYEQESRLVALTIGMDASKIELNARTENDRALPTLFYSQFTCADSVLRTVVQDEYSGNGAFMETSNIVLEMFSSEASGLNLRFIGTTMGAFFIIPYYNSRDELITLTRRETVEK